MTFGQRCGRKFHKNVGKLECHSCIFVQNYRFLFLDEVLCIYCATHSVSFLVSPFVQLKCKAKWLPDIFFNGDHRAKEVPPGTPFLGPVQYDRTFLGPVQYDRSFHGKHPKLLNIEKHLIFQQCKVNGTILLLLYGK